MSLRSFETAITAEARSVLKNPKLRVKDLLEWSTGAVQLGEGETVCLLPKLGINIAVLAINDKRNG